MGICEFLFAHMPAPEFPECSSDITLFSEEGIAAIMLPSGDGGWDGKSPSCVGLYDVHPLLCCPHRQPMNASTSVGVPRIQPSFSSPWGEA